MNIAIVQIYDNNIKEYAEYGRLINSIYATHQGYSYICWEYDLVPVSYSVYYNKIQALFQAMNNRPDIDWFLYLDSDAIVTNFQITIESIIDKFVDKEIILPHDDVFGQHNGVFLIKNSATMQEYLKTCYEDTRFFHTTSPEQTAMIYNIVEKYSAFVGWEASWFLAGFIQSPTVSSKVCGAERYHNQDSFILHLIGQPTAVRKQIFQQFLTRLGIYCLDKKEA